MKYLILAGLLAAGPPAWADPQPSGGAAGAPAIGDEQARKEEEKRKLEEEIARQLGAPATAPPAPAPASAATTAGDGVTGGNPLARLLLLPDISAIGSGALIWNQRDVETLSPRGEPVGPPGKLQPVFQELELALQAVVDPYLRADVFLTFDRTGAGVEEAYVTTLGLPAGFQVRAGTLKSPFGRLNQQHPHVWDFVGAPLAMSRLVAVEALEGPGLDVAWLAPLPWFAELHLAYQETVPGFETAGRRTGVARLLQYFDLAEGTTLGVGLSAARLDEPGSAVWRDLYGGDLFLKIRPPSGRAYLALQGEIFGQRLTGSGVPGSGGGLLGGYVQARDLLGGYLQALLRTSAYWGVGARWENAPAEVRAPATAPVPGEVTQRSGRENRWTALATWYPSEFQRLRLQASCDRLPGGSIGWETLLALEFAIGAHGAHPF